MDTVRVDIYYRPLRICWAIASTDIASFRKAVRYTHCFFGGRFNPIVFADRPEEATRILELFCADLVVPLGDAAVTKPFVDRFPHLINPMFPERLFIGEERHGYKLYQKFSKFDGDVKACLMQCENIVACGDPERTALLQDNVPRCKATCNGYSALSDLFGVGRGPTGPKAPVTTPSIFKP